MPRIGSKIPEFVLNGLNNKKYSNLTWVNPTKKIFKFSFAKFGSKGPWRENENILKDYAALMGRDYKGYSKERGTFTSALYNSDFLVRYGKTKNTYQLKSYADMQNGMHRDVLYTSDGESIPESPEPSSSNASSPQSAGGNDSPLDDHTYSRNGNSELNNVTPVVTSDDVEHLQSLALVLSIPPLNFVPHWDDIMDVIEEDLNCSDSKTKNVPELKYAENTDLSLSSLCGGSTDSAAGFFGQWSDVQAMTYFNIEHSNACGHFNETQLNGMEFLNEPQLNGIEFLNEPQLNGKEFLNKPQLNGKEFLNKPQLNGKEFLNKPQLNGKEFLNEPQLNGKEFLNEPQLNGKEFLNEPQLYGKEFLNEPQLNGKEFLNEPQLNGKEFLNEPQLYGKEFLNEPQLNGKEFLNKPQLNGKEFLNKPQLNGKEFLNKPKSDASKEITFFNAADSNAWEQLNEELSDLLRCLNEETICPKSACGY